METHARTGDWRITTLGTAILQSRFRTLNRPATPFELMDDAISYYRENFKPLFRVSLWVYLVPIISSLLLLGPIVYLDATSAGGSFAALVLDSLGFLLMLPYLMVAPIVQAAFTTLAFRMLAVGEPITFSALWARLKPRLLPLVLNQLPSILALSVVYLLLFVFWGASFIMAIAAGGGGMLASIMYATLALAITIFTLVLAAMISVWFVILPQIVVLENRVDAINAFARAFALVRPNFKHAVLSHLAFWGVQAVLLLSVMLLLYLILGIIVGIIAIYADLEQILSRWWLSINQVYESLLYIAYMFVMPAMYMTSILLYFDLRYRSEGLDIYEVLQQGAQS